MKIKRLCFEDKLTKSAIELDAKCFGVDLKKEPSYYWYRQDAEVGYSLVAVERNKIIGVLFSHLTTDSKIFITALCVHPQYRRKGIANSLIKRLIEYAIPRGIRIECLAKDTNIASKKMLGKLGFIEKKKIINSYFYKPMKDTLWVLKKKEEKEVSG